MRKRMLILAASSLLSSGAAMANPFDNSDEYILGQSKYIVYYKDYVSACGSYDTIDDSNIFGRPDRYSIYYPKLGRLDAELAQVRAIKSSTRSKLEDIFVDAEHMIGEGADTLKLGMRSYLIAMKSYSSSTAKMNNLPTDIKDAFENNKKDILGLMESTRNEAYSDAMSRLKSDGASSTDGYGQSMSAYQRWQQCQAFWEYQEDNQSLIRGRGL